jgi:hypothetical protein
LKNHLLLLFDPGDVFYPLPVERHVGVDSGDLAYGALVTKGDDPHQEVVHDEGTAAVTLATVSVGVLETGAELVLIDVREHPALIPWNDRQIGRPQVVLHFASHLRGTC